MKISDCCPSRESGKDKTYVDFNNSVVEYFKDKQDQFLIINLNETDAAIKICRFLETKKIIDKIPWENKT